MNEKHLSDEEKLKFTTSRSLYDAAMLKNAAKFVYDKGVDSKRSQPRLQVPDKMSSPDYEPLRRWQQEIEKEFSENKNFLVELISKAILDNDTEAKHYFSTMAKEGVYVYLSKGQTEGSDPMSIQYFTVGHSRGTTPRETKYDAYLIKRLDDDKEISISEEDIYSGRRGPLSTLLDGRNKIRLYIQKKLSDAPNSLPKHGMFGYEVIPGVVVSSI